MSRSPKKRKLRSSGPPTPTAEWRDHEHVAEHAQAEAQRLLESTGTPELAKHAIDVAGERQEYTARDDFARRAGFASFQELLAASAPVTAANGQTWYATPVPNHKWIAWNEVDLRDDQWDSQEAAIRWINESAASESAGQG